MSTIPTTPTAIPVVSFTAEKQYPSFSGIVNQMLATTDISTAGAVTYTAAQVMGGLIRRDTNGAGRTDTLPSAALLLPTIEQAKIGASKIRFFIYNDSAAANSITVNAGNGGTVKNGAITITQTEVQEFLLVVTNAGLNPTYDLYTL